MNLVFYSDAKFEENNAIEKEVVTLIRNKNSKWAFIPSQTDVERKYYKRFIDYYSPLGYRNFEYLDLDKEFQPGNLSELMKSDVIYLSGGNTFYFLYKIKEIGADQKLRNFAKLPGKTILGVSAGAMIMTPTIMNTVVQHRLKGDFEDLNKAELTDFSGLGLVDFEFIPHYSEINKGQMLKKYLPETKNKVYGCPDGSGIIVEDNKVRLLGDVSILK